MLSQSQISVGNWIPADATMQSKYVLHLHLCVLFVHTYNLLKMALNMPPMTWYAYKGQSFSLVLSRNVRNEEAAGEEV